MFSALQSTSGPLTYSEKPSKSIYNWRRYPSSNWYETDQKNAVQNLALCCGAIWRHREKPQFICAQLQSILYTTAQKIFGKIYFLYDFWCAQTCSFRGVFWTTYTKFDNCCLRYVVTRRKFLYRCTSTFSVLSCCSGIFFKSLSYLHELVRTNFSADFWTFRNFWPQFREICGAT